MFSQIHSNGTLCVKYNTPDKIPPTRSKYTQASIKMLVLSALFCKNLNPQKLLLWIVLSSNYGGRYRIRTCHLYNVNVAL